MNAKMLNKLLEQTKNDAARIKSLEAKLAVADATREAAVAEIQMARDMALAAAKQELIAKLEAGDVLLAEARKLIAEYHAHIVRDDEEISNLKKGRLADSEALSRAADHVGKTIAQLELYEQQKLELTKLCDKVRERMRRKELAEESAILNRKAVTFKPLAPNFNLPRSED
jgi:hypothetical protein